MPKNKIYYRLPGSPLLTERSVAKRFWYVLCCPLKSALFWHVLCCPLKSALFWHVLCCPLKSALFWHVLCCPLTSALFFSFCVYGSEKINFNLYMLSCYCLVCKYAGFFVTMQTDQVPSLQARTAGRQSAVPCVGLHEAGRQSVVPCQHFEHRFPAPSSKL